MPRPLLDTAALIDLLALAWMLAGVLLGLTRGLAPLFSWLLWVLASLWLASVLAPVLVGWLPNTHGADGPQGRLLAYGSLAALSLGLPLLGRLLGNRRGQPRQAAPKPSDRSLAVVAGLVCALLTLTLALPFVGNIPRLGRSYDRAIAADTGRRVSELLPWLFPVEHRAALSELCQPTTTEPWEREPSWEPGTR